MKATISCAVEPETALEIKRISKILDVSASSFIREIILSGLEDYEKNIEQFQGGTNLVRI